MRLSFHVYGANPDEITTRARAVIDHFTATTAWTCGGLDISCNPLVENDTHVTNWQADVDAIVTPSTDAKPRRPDHTRTVKVK